MHYDNYKQTNNTHNNGKGMDKSTHSTNSLAKHPMYTTWSSHNISSHSNNMANSKNMKSQLSKKMIKNFMNTHRDHKDLISKFDVEKERNISNDKKLNTYRKTSNSREKKGEHKRPKSSIEKAAKAVATKARKTPVYDSKFSQPLNSNTSGLGNELQNQNKVPSTFNSPTGVCEEPKYSKNKVKVYRVDKDKHIIKNDDRATKHLKSKSQSNFNSTAVIDSKGRKTKAIKTKK